MSIFEVFQRVKPERYPFNSYFDAETFLEIEGFKCINGAWIRGRNEFAQITTVTPTLVSVRIGKTLH